MWKIKKKTIPHQWLEFEPETIIDEYDCPMLFTLRDAAGAMYLAYFCDRDADSVRFLVVTTNDDIHAKLVGGDIDLREALIRPGMWLFDLDRQWTPIRCWRAVISELPKNLLPKPGVMLRANMRPVTKQAIVQPITHTTMLNLRFRETPEPVVV